MVFSYRQNSDIGISINPSLMWFNKGTNRKTIKNSSIGLRPIIMKCWGGVRRVGGPEGGMASGQTPQLKRELYRRLVAPGLRPRDPGGSQQFRGDHNRSGGASQRIQSRTGSDPLSPRGADEEQTGACFFSCSQLSTYEGGRRRPPTCAVRD